MKHTLSPRQVEVMQLVCRGLVAKEIAIAKGISALTVKNHMRDAKRKLAARNMVQAAVLFTLGNLRAVNTL